MTTFDIAVKYLEGLDLSLIDLYSEKQTDQITAEDQDIMAKVLTQMHLFQADPDNTRSNSNYRGVVFACATIHLTFKQKGLVSFYNVAQEIVDSYKHLYKTDFEKYENTDYPKEMLEQWLSYCNSKPELAVLSEANKLRNDFFYVAYHHLLEPETA